MVRLSMRRLEAIEEALSSRLAGEMDIHGDVTAPTEADYETAHSWVCQEIDRRKSKACALSKAVA